MSYRFSEMPVRVLRPSELSDVELTAWRRLQSLSPQLDNAFLAPEFTQAVGSSSIHAYVGVVHDRGRPVAFLPFERGHLGIGRSIGYGVCDAQALICTSDFDVDPSWLLRACGIGILQFDNLVFRMDRLARWSRGQFPSHVMDLRQGYDAYLEDGGRRHRHLYRSLMQKRRKLVREHGELEFIFSSADHGALTTLMQWKSEQYERTGRCDRFSRKWVRDLVGRLEDLREPGCQGVLSTLSTGGRLVAAHFGIRTQTRLSGWFPAYDVSFSQYSPGLQLFLLMAESASAHGVELIDLGKGDESYKAEIGSWTYPVACGRVEAHQISSFACRLRGRGLRSLDEFVLGHPRVRSILPAALARVDRVPAD